MRRERTNERAIDPGSVFPPHEHQVQKYTYIITLTIEHFTVNKFPDFENNPKGRCRAQQNMETNA